MNNIHKHAVKSALKKMFSGTHFSICTINSLVEMTGVIPDAQVHKVMQSQHCVNFSEMDRELRDFLYKQSVIMFAGAGFDFEILDAVFDTNSNVRIVKIDSPQEKPNFLKRLIG